MLYVNTISYYDSDNSFRLREILVSDGTETYVVSPEDNFEVSGPYQLDSQELVASYEAGITYPVLGFSKTRALQDDDPKALAAFFSHKFGKLGATNPQKEKAVFDTLAGFGHAL